MNLDKLEEILKDEPKYRLAQVKEAIFKNLVEIWADAVYLPQGLKDKLEKECPLKIDAEISESDGGETVKAIITLADGLQVESVLMRHEGGRATVCVSSQIGCPMKCGFCATGLMGLKRSLTESEIVEQVIFFARYLKKDSQERVSNVVFMGMGEPFLNYDNVLAAARMLNDKEGLNIGARKISISTSGVVEGIEKLANEGMQINLAISLHAPTDELRSKLMPINKKYSLKNVLAAVDNYITKTSRQVVFEYVLLEGINDSVEDAQKLAKLMNKPLYFVNLIKYNPTGMEGMKPASKESIKRFREILEENGVAVSQRYHFGGNIKAACGQLRV